MHTTDAQAGGPLRRDAALAFRIAGMLFHYLTAGGRLRRAYRRCQDEGCVYWLDGDGAPPPEGTPPR